jgi:hypothetical protein
MKFTIEGFSQQNMVDLGMDATDALILRWFVDFSATGEMATIFEDGKPLYWIKYSSLLEDMPIIGITNKDALAKRLRKMVDSEILVHRHVLKGGSFSYFGFGKLYSTLLFKSRTPPAQESDPSDSKVGTNDPSSRDSSTKDTLQLFQEETAPTRPPLPKVEPDFEEKVWIGDLEPVVKHWQEIYPGLDINGEMFNAMEYAIAHPEKQYKKWYAYLSNWMRNANKYAERRGHAQLA